MQQDKRPGWQTLLSVVILGLDPSNPDTDGDGIADGLEAEPNDVTHAVDDGSHSQRGRGTGR